MILHITLAYFSQNLALDLKVQNDLTHEVLTYQNRDLHTKKNEKTAAACSNSDKDHRLMLALTPFCLHFFTDMQSYTSIQPEVYLNI